MYVLTKSHENECANQDCCCQFTHDVEVVNVTDSLQVAKKWKAEAGYRNDYTWVERVP